MEGQREAAAAENREHHAWLARLLRCKRSPGGAGVVYSVVGDEFDDSLDSSIHSLSKHFLKIDQEDSPPCRLSLATRGRLGDTTSSPP